MDLGDPSGLADGVTFVYVMAGQPAGGVAFAYVMAGQHAGGVAFGYVMAERPADRNLLRTSDCIHLVHEQPAEDNSLSALTEVDRTVVRILHKPGGEEGHRPRTNAVGLPQSVSRSLWVAAGCSAASGQYSQPTRHRGRRLTDESRSSQRWPCRFSSDATGAIRGW